MIPQPTHDVITGEKLPKAFNGCTCSCHRISGVYHCVPCCYPMDDDFRKELLRSLSEEIDDES